MQERPTNLEAQLALSLGLVLTACQAWTLEEAQAADLALPVLRALPGEALALGLVDQLERGMTCYKERARRDERVMRRDSLAASLAAAGGAA